MPVRPCLRCGRLVEAGSYCNRHTAAKRPSPSAVDPTRTPRMRRRALERARHRCERCGSRDRLQVDAIVAVAKCGDHRDTNTQVLCLPCHRRKTLAELRSRDP